MGPKTGPKTVPKTGPKTGPKMGQTSFVSTVCLGTVFSNNCCIEHGVKDKQTIIILFCSKINNRRAYVYSGL